MKIFIFEDVGQVSSNYHSGGGLNVIAENEEKARELMDGDVNIKVTDHEWLNVTVYGLVGEHEPMIIVFPDAGCC